MLQLTIIDLSFISEEYLCLMCHITSLALFLKGLKFVTRILRNNHGAITLMNAVSWLPSY